MSVETIPEMTRDERAQKWYGLVDATGLVYVAVKRGTWRAPINGISHEGQRSQVLGISDTYEIACNYMAERYAPHTPAPDKVGEGEWVGVTIADVTPMFFRDFTKTTLDVQDAAFAAKLEAVQLLRNFSLLYATGTDPNARNLTLEQRNAGADAIMWASNVINGWARGLKRIDQATGESAEIDDLLKALGE